jgi:hypothetical protein
MADLALAQNLPSEHGAIGFAVSRMYWFGVNGTVLVEGYAGKG